MSATATRRLPAVSAVAGFGLACTRLRIDHAAATLPGELLFEASCLLGCASEVFEALAESDEAPPTFLAGLYLLRQGLAVLEAAQLSPAADRPDHGGDA